MTKHSIVAAVLMITIIAGCGDAPAIPVAVSPPVAPVAQSIVEVQKPDSKVAAFNEAVAVYVKEARAGLKLFELGLSVQDATEKSKQITDLYVHLPEVPQGVDATLHLSGKLKEINGNFAAAVQVVSLSLQNQQLGNAEGVKKSAELLTKTIAITRQLANDIEAELAK